MSDERWQVFWDADASGSYWVAYLQSTGELKSIWEPFDTHAEAVAYADRMARTNQGETNEEVV